VSLGKLVKLPNLIKLLNLTKFSVLRQLSNAAIKPSATAVAHRRCKRRQLKMGACSQIFNFAFWGIYAATDIAEAER
jgi:hypothetical protein